MTKCYILIDNSSIKKKFVNFFNGNDINYSLLTNNDIDNIAYEDLSHHALFIDSVNLAKYSDNFSETNAPLLHTILIQNTTDNALSKKQTNICDLILNLPLNQAKLARIYNFVNKFNTLDLNAKNIDTFDYGYYFLEGTSQVLNSFKKDLKSIAKSDNNICITGSLGTEKVRVLNYIIDNVRAKGEKLFYCRCQQIMDSDNPKTELTNIFKKLTANITSGSLAVIFQPYHLDEELQEYLYSLLSENSEIQYITISQYSTSSLSFEFNFHKGLLSLLSESTLEVPVLSNRKHDIPHIVDYLKKRLISIYGCQEIKFSTTALITLQSCEWLGNYIELRNIIESLIINAVENQIDTIESKDLPSDLFIVNQDSLNPSVNYDIMSKDLKEARSIFERQYIEAQIRRFGGNVSHTANFIGMERTALHRKLAFLGILSDDVRSSIKGYRRSSNA
jgi:DNA-binding NtrC family response regulator